jgi:hypothetical protein
VLCHPHAKVPWGLATNIDYVTIDYLYPRVLTELSFVTTMVDNILCRRSVDSVGVTSCSPTAQGVK